MNKVYFDEALIDEFGVYVQVCEGCASDIKQVRDEVKIEEGDGLGFCGVAQCTNQAKYHGDLK